MITLKPKNIDNLLYEFKQRNLQPKDSQKLNFEVDDFKDVYNITAPFKYGNEILIAGRVEKRDSELSEVIFFKNKEGIWIKKTDLPIFKLQDPFISWIDEYITFGGVEVLSDPVSKSISSYKTVFYKGKTLKDLKPFAEGPELMKDIRLLQLKNSKILVLTRPKINNNSHIGYTLINSLKELNPQVISNATVIEGQFAENEWGGANSIYELPNGLVAVLGHIAKFDDLHNRHYYSMSFSFNPDTGQSSPLKIIATRNNFGKASYKRPDLIDVIFSGGLIRNNNGYAELYCGISDAEAHKLTIADPFKEYEH
ncbi:MULTISPECIES: DUF1861 family protein [Clostridium]|uniref:DUF1861 family protein n=1 Tax=Clostridium TaxID=1485 RepID=UPI0008252ED3|nr:MULTISPECIES: DUF1861 family protein [Clostridium]PJI08707.1 DUF1861 domain-containing protein [Clostridium sp. CT7]